MVTWLLRFFIPHKKNDHRPHVLRTQATVVLLAIIIGAESLFLYSSLLVYPRSSLFSLILPSVLAQDVNEARTTVEAPQLTVNGLLTKAAQMKADDMAAKGYFAHTSPDGSTPWVWIQKAGYQYEAAGENLAVNFIDSQDVHNAWMNSPSHRKNILNPAYTEIGIATATGTYKGKQAVFVVQMFGKPKVVRVATKLSPTIAPTSRPLSSDVTPSVSAPLPAVEGAATQADRVLSMPHTMTSGLLQIILIVVTSIVALTLLLWTELRHPRLIVNGMAVIALSFGLLLLNQHVATLFAQIL